MSKTHGHTKSRNPEAPLKRTKRVQARRGQRALIDNEVDEIEFFATLRAVDEENQFMELIGAKNPATYVNANGVFCSQ